jgi:hypothetical protein
MLLDISVCYIYIYVTVYCLFMMFLSENRKINIYALINTSTPAKGYILLPLLFTLSRVVLTLI